MANNPNRTYNVKVAAPSKKSKFDLPKIHICTSDFGVLKSIDCRLYVPGDDFRFKVSQFTRLMPMPVPTYGDVKSITRCFVVPINDVMGNFNDFISKNYSRGNAATTSLVSPAIPYFGTKNFVELFCGRLYPDLAFDSPFATNYGISENPPEGSFDAVIRARSGNNYIGVKFNYIGRKVVSWLHGLGLNWQWSLMEEDNQYISALPILCWWKFYLDWIVPSRFRNDFAFVYNILGISFTSSYCNLFQHIMASNYENFAKLFSPVSCYYSDDYFTNAFISPYGVENVSPSDAYNNYNKSGQYDSSGDFTIPTASLPTSPSSNGPTLQTGVEIEGSQYNVINYFSLQSLCILQDMVNSGKLAGTKVQDYLYTTYGIRPDDDVLHLSKYLGAHRNTIQIGDIKSTATTDFTSGGSTRTSYLGQFAGVASGGNVDTFDFKDFDSHAYIFLTNELSIRPSYTQGNHIEFTARSRQDFYDGRFDGIGVTAIPFKELCSDFTYENGYDSTIPHPNDVFGFRPTYAEHKTSFDIISGDFRCGTLNTGLDSWFLNRQINAEYLRNVGTYINRKFCEQVSDSNNYDRIFQVANNDSDHFYSVFNIDCTAYRHMISLEDSLETESRDTSESHDTVKVDFQGTVNS